MRWFRAVARAMVKNGVKALAGAVPFGEVLLAVGQDVWQEYHNPEQARNDAQLRHDLQEAAVAPRETVGKVIDQAIRDEAAEQRPEVKKALTEYLELVPHSIRRSFRRPSVPEGTTVPATLTFTQPSARRNRNPPGGSNRHIGFRVVCVVTLQ